MTDTVQDQDLEQLALRAQAGCRDAFGRVVARLEQPLYRFLLVRVGSAREAEELTHDAFVRAWIHLDRYRARWRFSTWLYTIARRLAVSHQRDRRRQNAGHDPDVDPGSEASSLDLGPVEHLSTREQCRNVWSLARRVLNAEQVSALWLRYAEERDLAEVGRILGKRPTATRVLVHRARHKLAAALAPVEVDPIPAYALPRVARPGAEG